MPSHLSPCQLVILFLSVEFSTVSCDIFYIVTSPSSPCPGEYIGVPCLTLQQYASNPSRSQNITFLIESGMYNLSTVLTVSDGYNFTMSSTNATVICTSATAKFEFNRVENVYISGMTFQGCRNGAAVKMLRVVKAIINTSYFRNNGGYYPIRGRAIYMTYSNITINKSYFINNIAYGHGGAIYAEYSNVTLESSEFSQNYAYSSGGAIYYNSDDSMSYINKLQMSNTVVYSNRASFQGGALCIYNYASMNNRYGNSDIRLQLMLYNLTAYSNRASSQGGAIYVYNYVYMNNRDGNSDIRLGILLYNFTVYSNRAYQGGAMYIYNEWYNRYGNLDFQLEIYNLTAYSNSASYGGGAIYVYNYNRYGDSDFQLEMNNITANNNRADRGDGGAVYIYIYNNNRYGQNLNFQLNVHNISAHSNRAGRGNGGAIYIGSSGIINSRTSVTQCQFINNTANQGSGGALYLSVDTMGINELLTIDHNYYSSNIASSLGGALYINGTNSSVSVISTTFMSNRAVTEGGGAIYSDGQYANVTLTSSTFHNNSASYCSVLDVDNYNHFSVNLTNNIFTYNTASGQTIGGGVACIRNASINIIDSTFKHNFANHHAGVFYIDESQTTVDGSLFINNSAALDGGVFYTYIHASDYIIRRSQFSENIAGDDGGVMLIGRLNCYVSIDETIFDFNSAGDRGGVVAIIASSILMEINRTNIFNNTAQFGGVISACNSLVTLLDDGLFVTVDPLLPFCILYEGDIQSYNITAPRDPEIFITEFLTTTEQQMTTELLTTTEILTTTESQTTEQITMPTTTEIRITTEPLITIMQTTTETIEESTEPTATEAQITTKPLTTTEQVATSEPLTSTEPPITTKEPTTEPLATTTDLTADVCPPATTATNTAPPSTVADENSTTLSTTSIHTPSTRNIMETTSIMPSTTTATILNQLTNSSESLGKDIGHFATTRDQTTSMELESDKKSDVYNIVVADSELNTVLSAISLALFLVLAVAMFVCMLLLYAQIKKVKGSKSAKIELTKMREFTTKTMDPKDTSNTYTSPTHNRCCTEEKVDLM